MIIRGISEYETDNFYLMKMSRETSKKPIIPKIESIGVNRLLQKNGNLTKLEQSLREFELHKNKICEDILLNFPTDIREYFEGQNLKLRTELKDNLLAFEKDMYSFDEIQTFISGYKV